MFKKLLLGSVVLTLLVTVVALIRRVDELETEHDQLIEYISSAG